MLINKGHSAGDVVTVKLTSSEELIARFEGDDAHGYKISKPMVLSMTPKGPGLMPYLFTVNPDTTITLSFNSVTVITTTDKDFANQYLQSTTGITLA